MKKLLLLACVLLLPLTACLRDSAYEISCHAPANQCKGTQRTYQSDPCGKDGEDQRLLKKAKETCEKQFASSCEKGLACVCTVKRVRPRSCSVNK
jgi:hypothetical protein